MRKRIVNLPSAVLALAVAFALAAATGCNSLSARGAGPARIDTQGRLFHGDGHQVFPVGIYAAVEARWVDLDPNKVERLLDDLADSPFTFIINYGDTDGTPEQRAQLLAMMESRGIADFFSLKDHYPALRPTVLEDTDQDSVVRSVVRAHRDSPAVVGWYISDEPKGDPTPVLEQHRRVKSEDPARPTLMVSHLSGHEKLAPWVPTADILAVDPYPIPKRPISDAGERVRTMKQLAGQKPVWFVLQAFGGYQYDERVRDQDVKLPSAEMLAQRPPTEREMRCMTYGALASGADGVVVYYHKDLIEGVDAARRWPAVKQLAQELIDLSPVLLASDAPLPPARKSNEQVLLRTKQTHAGLTFIVANMSSSTQSCILTLPHEVRSAAVRSGSCIPYVLGNELLLILDGYEGAVVESTMSAKQP